MVRISVLKIMLVVMYYRQNITENVLQGALSNDMM